MGIQVAALTSGINVPPARFRIRQHIQPLRQYGIQVQEYIPRISKYGLFGHNPQGFYRWLALPAYSLWQGMKLLSRIPGIVGCWNSQITWLERELITGIFTLEWLLRKPVVLDVDDAIWLTFPFSPSMLRMIARQVDVVVVGNSFLADWFSATIKDIRIIPTAIDTKRFHPKMKAEDNDGVVIGWTGGSWNLSYLYAIEKPLGRVLKRYKQARLRVVCDQPPIMTEIPLEQIDYIPWSAHSEVSAVQGMDIGLMPLPDNDWARGKCSFKMLQYMACGLPVVVSPVGMNADVLALNQVGLPASTPAQWEDALSTLITDRLFARNMGLNGIRVVEKYFSREVVTAQLADVFVNLN